MFTGIVEEIGDVTAVEPSGDGVRLTVRAPNAVSDAAHGDSISVSGVCLTVVDQGADWFTADVMADARHVDARRRRRRPRRQHRARDASRTAASADTSCRATSTAPARCSRCARARSGACCASALPAAARSARRRQGLDRGRRRLAHRQRGQRRRRRRTQWFEVSLIPETLDGHDPRRAAPSATTSTSRPTSWRATCSACFFRGSGRTRAPRGHFTQHTRTKEAPR